MTTNSLATMLRIHCIAPASFTHTHPNAAPDGIDCIAPASFTHTHPNAAPDPALQLWLAMKYAMILSLPEQRRNRKCFSPKVFRGSIVRHAQAEFGSEEGLR
jgi:hypothetical protein